MHFEDFDQIFYVFLVFLPQIYQIHPFFRLIYLVLSKLSLISLSYLAIYRGTFSPLAQPKKFISLIESVRLHKIMNKKIIITHN